MAETPNDFERFQLPMGIVDGFAFMKHGELLIFAQGSTGHSAWIRGESRYGQLKENASVQEEIAWAHWS